MIINIWRPKFKIKENKRIIEYYEKIDYVDFYSDKKTGYIIIYSCDECNSGRLNKTNSSSLLNSKYSNLENQICRSCRSRVSEYEIKNTRVDFDIIEKSFLNEYYFLITDSVEYYSSENSSQLKLKVVCKNEHDYYTNWNNWKRGKRCRTCYDEKRRSEAVKYKEGFDLYLYEVCKLTNYNYRKFKNKINPNNLQRGITDYHLDHIYSIHDGFKNNIPVYIISDVKNLRMIKYDLNLKKGKRSDISINNLLIN